MTFAISDEQRRLYIMILKDSMSPQLRVGLVRLEVYVINITTVVSCVG